MLRHNRTTYRGWSRYIMMILSLQIICFVSVQGFHGRSVYHNKFSIHKSDMYRCHQRFSLCMTTQRDNESSHAYDGVLEEIREKLRSSNYEDAYQLLKRNPLAPLTLADGMEFLNNLELLVPGTEENDEKRLRQLTDATSFIYKRLERQHLLRGFGCVDGEYPEKGTDISPTVLEDLTGISINALTPRTRASYWQTLSIGVAFAEYVIADAFGLDPLFTVLPATFLLIFSDQLFLKGAIFESIYQLVNPEFRRKVVCHEAGHFLLAYLSGVPIRNCITTAWEARKYPEISGQAGTIYYDTKLSDEIAGSKVTRSSLDRLSVVTMAGIAAEALKFSRAEGGIADERALIQILTSIQPPWNILRIQGQARWAAVQAILLIREHQASFDALVKVLEEKKGVGEAILAIEQNLPEVLPSVQRIEQRKIKQKTADMDVLMRFIQKMTWRVGGLENNHNADDAVISDDGFLNRRPGADFQQNNSTSTVSVDLASSPSTAVKLFTERIRQLETAVKDGVIDIPESSGGIWLNGLETMDKNSQSTESTAESELGRFEPLEGFEQRIAELQATEKIATDSENHQTEIIGSFSKDDESPELSLLKNHRGFQRKQLENILRDLRNKAMSIEERLATIEKSISVKSTLVKK